jgi:hypothetical protein
MHLRLAACLLAAALSVIVAVTAYAQTLTATVNHHMTANYRGTNDLGSPIYTLDQGLQAAIALGNGTGTNQVSRLFSDTRTLAASATENLDLAGVLTDPFGNVLTFATVKVLKFCAAAGNVNNVVIGGAAVNAFVGPFGAAAHTLAVRPGGCFVWIAPQAGAAVTPGTSDLLQVANSGAGTAVTYDVIILGTH